MTSNHVGENINEPLVQYVPINDYLLPPAPITHHARERLVFFAKLFQSGEPEQVVPVKSKENLAVVPSCLLGRLTSVPDWVEFADTLHVQLRDWLSNDRSARPLILLVGPPNSGTSETLESLAERQGWRLLGPPTYDQILEQDDTWFSEQEGDDTQPWVLPALEKVYLRHAEGLSLIRGFLDDVSSGKRGMGIIGCDSWAWAYLSRLWRGPIPTILTLQSFDEQKLISHLQKMAHASCSRQLLFRQSDNGKYVLPLQNIDSVSGEYSNFLHILGAHSRGNLGVALSVWRSCLLAEPDKYLEEEKETEEPDVPQQTIWVIPWKQIELPSLPKDAGKNEAFVLHTLLVHNGLPLEMLTLLLPLSSSQTIETIYRLQERGLVGLETDFWRVTPMGYPGVRNFLQSRSYLVDQF